MMHLLLLIRRRYCIKSVLASSPSRAVIATVAVSSFKIFNSMEVCLQLKLCVCVYSYVVLVSVYHYCYVATELHLEGPVIFFFAQIVALVITPVQRYFGIFWQSLNGRAVLAAPFYSLVCVVLCCFFFLCVGSLIEGAIKFKVYHYLPVAKL